MSKLRLHQVSKLFSNNPLFCVFQFTLMSKLRSYQEREEYLYRALNQDPSLDIRLLESAKILMMVTAIELYHDYVAGRDVPTFAWLLFARDTSQTPQALFLNHLNLVGDAAGLEMVRYRNDTLKVFCDTIGYRYFPNWFQCVQAC